MFHDQDGAGRHLHNLLGDTADEGVFESTSTVGGHHDQIDVFVACVLHDLNMGRTDSQRGHDVDLTDRFSQLDLPFSAYFSRRSRMLLPYSGKATLPDVAIHCASMTCSRYSEAP